MDITIQELNTIRSNIHKYFVNFTDGFKLKDMTRKLTDQEIIALAYFESVVQFLNSKGAIKNVSDCKVNLYTDDSAPGSEDYS
jgi:hypothetical protein